MINQDTQCDLYTVSSIGEKLYKQDFLLIYHVFKTIKVWRLESFFVDSILLYSL